MTRQKYFVTEMRARFFLSSFGIKPRDVLHEKQARWKQAGPVCNLRNLLVFGLWSVIWLLIDHEKALLLIKSLQHNRRLTVSGLLSLSSSFLKPWISSSPRRRGRRHLLQESHFGWLSDSYS